MDADANISLWEGNDVEGKITAWIDATPKPYREGDKLVIPCSGQGLDNGVDPTPCGCVLYATDADLEIVLQDKFTADLVANKYPGWNVLKSHVIRGDQWATEEPTKFAMFCRAECMLAWLRAQRGVSPTRP